MIESGIVTKTFNSDLTNYKLDYYAIIKVLIEHRLIICLAGGYYGAIDNKEIIWACDYNKALPCSYLGLDAVLLGLKPEYYDLQDHLMKLYIQYKNKEINQNCNVKLIQEKIPKTQFDRYIVGNPFF